MEATPSPSPRPLPGPPSSIDVEKLEERARVLQQAAQAGASPMLLRGKKFGLVCGASDVSDSDCALIDRAATELGAQVAHIQPRLNEHSGAHDVQQTAHMLGLLYDAVICEGLPAALVQQLRLDAGIPVHDHLAAMSHDIAAASTGSLNDVRFVLQALLLSAME
ncbi:MAG: hypothetical protein RLZZ618_62 [Pseudomonadota bacterium]|jgi:ornithine carbamoyltransferase